MQKEEILEEILSYYSTREKELNQEELVEMLREIQEVFGCISKNIQEQAARYLNINISMIENLIRLYPSLKASESRHTITVCMGRQCQMRGSAEIMAAAEKVSGAGKGETSKDGRFSLTQRSCLKHCRTAPNLMVDDDLYTFVKPGDIERILKKYK